MTPEMYAGHLATVLLYSLLGATTGAVLAIALAVGFGAAGPTALALLVAGMLCQHGRCSCLT